LKGEDHLGDLDIDEIKWLLDKHDLAMWTGFIWLRTGSVMCLFEHGNKIQNCIKGEEFLE
jgi:hypothetical protein